MGAGSIARSLTVFIFWIVSMLANFLIGIGTFASAGSKT